jgi:hypothetical protein
VRLEKSLTPSKKVSRTHCVLYWVLDEILYYVCVLCVLCCVLCSTIYLGNYCFSCPIIRSRFYVIQQQSMLCFLPISIIILLFYQMTCLKTCYRIASSVYILSCYSILYYALSIHYAMIYYVVQYIYYVFVLSSTHYIT